tara:strand:- start:784 stop:906 length:123 start_codon:yes stop_codon:yes gene_type:complete
MFFGLSKQKIIGFGIIATAIKLIFGFWLFARMGWHLPFIG